MGVNKVILLGYVGRDPEVRYPEKGAALAKFTLATTEKVGESGNEVTEWHIIVATGRNAEIAERYIRKGTRLYVEGSLRTRDYEDRLHISRKVTEILVSRMELLGRSSNQ